MPSQTAQRARLLGAAGLLVRSMGEDPRLLARRLLTNEIRGNGKPFQVVGLERGHVECNEFGIRLAPRATQERLASSFDLDHALRSSNWNRKASRSASGSRARFTH